MLNKDNLHNYQKAGVDHIINNDSCGLFLDMGLGKTVTTLTAINFLIYEDLEIDTVLVIAPKRVAENVWQAEVENWAHLQHLTVSRIMGKPKQRLAALKKKADVYTIGRDNIAWLCGLHGGSMLPFDMLVIDESSSFKSAKSQRFKALRKVIPSFERVVLLTGTPAPNGLIDLWAQIYLLDRGERLGKFISHYRDEFFKPGKRNGDIIYSYDLQKTGEERIYAKISDICMSMKKEDYLDLPGITYNYIEVGLPAKLQKQYDEFEKELVLELFEEAEDPANISAVNAASLSNKLLQFASGAVYDEDHVAHTIHDLKLAEAEAIIEQAGGKPVLIFRNYKHECSRLLTKLKKYEPRELKTEQDIKDWNAGNIRVMLMHPASGGHGLNLQHGGTIILWFGPTWNLEHYQQANARLYRQGQKEKVIVHHLVAAKTIDQDVVKALERKSAGQEGLMKAIKSKLKKYSKYILNR